MQTKFIYKQTISRQALAPRNSWHGGSRRRFRDFIFNFINLLRQALVLRQILFQPTLFWYFSAASQAKLKITRKESLISLLSIITPISLPLQVAIATF